MPIYEYQCTECGAEQEVLQKLSDEPLRDCPACGQSALRKKVSAAAFRLKGSGWYETDFKSGNKKNLAGDDSSDGSSDGSKSGAKDSGKSGSGSADSASAGSGEKAANTSASKAEKGAGSSAA